MKNIGLEVLPLLAAGLIGCQDLADADTRPPALASIRGTLSLAANVTAPRGDIRVAILWTTHSDDERAPEVDDPDSPCEVDPSQVSSAPHAWGAGGYSRFRTTFAQQQVEVESEFPVQFRLDIDEPPPQAALTMQLLDYFQPDAMAEGQFVVYRDANRNGTLDPSMPNKPSPDEILSVSAGPAPPAPDRSYTLQYIERRPMFDEKAARAGLRSMNPTEEDIARYAHLYDYLDPGYNLVRLDPQLATAKRLPDDTTVALVLNPNPSWQRAVCAETCGEPADTECPANPADLPERDSRARFVYESELGSSWYYADGAMQVEAYESCDASESGAPSYAYTRYECEACVCKVLACNYQSDTLPAGAALPCATR